MAAYSPRPGGRWRDGPGNSGTMDEDPVIVTVAVAGSPEAATADFVCDGSADEIEINAAIESAAMLGGGVVRLSAGAYSTSAPIRSFSDGVALEGDPAGGTSITPGANWVSVTGPDGATIAGVVCFIGVDDFAARYLTIESGGRLMNGLIAIPTGPNGAGDICTNGVFDSNVVRMEQGHTYSIWSLRAQGMEIINNLVDGGATVELAHTSQEGIEIYGGRDVLISGNEVTGIGNAAILLTGLAAATPDSSVEDITITDNHISNSRLGVSIGTTWSLANGAANATNILIEDNRFESLFEAGLLVRNWTGNLLDPPELSNLTFRNNQVELLYSAAADYTPSAVWMLDATAPGETVKQNILVEGNSFETVAADSVPPRFWLSETHAPFIALESFSGVTISDNALELTESGQYSRGVLVYHSQGIAVSGNEIVGSGAYPIEFYDSAGFSVDGNRASQWGRGELSPAILVDMANDYSITANELNHSLGGAAPFMIAIANSLEANSLAGNSRGAEQSATLAGSLLQHLVLAGSATSGTGNDLDNNITGNPLANALDGGAGADRLDGGAGADRMDGGVGDDDYTVDSDGDLVVELEDEGDDHVGASIDYTLPDHVERLTLTGAAVSGTGNVLDNVITGNALGNLLDGGAGADRMVGGAGDDHYLVDSAGDVVIELNGGGRDIIATSISYALAASSHVELLSAGDPDGTEMLNLTGNWLANEIRGNAGNNAIQGGGGADILAGLGGDDIYYIDYAIVQVLEAVGGGNDRVHASVSYALAAGSEVELLGTNSDASTAPINLTGNGFGQILTGNAGNNLLHGGGGTDTLYGFGGNDTYFTDVAATQIIEAAGGGSDTVYASISYTLGAGSEVEFLSTNNHGATSAINLTGNGFANTLIGNAGANTLDGKGGNDVLHGLGGADTFAFTTALGAGNVDQLPDFVAGLDRIALDDAIFTGLAPGSLPAGAFRTGTAAAEADDRIVYNSTTGALFFDADGNGAGAAVQFAWLNPGLALQASDFSVI